MTVAGLSIQTAMIIEEKQATWMLKLTDAAMQQRLIVVRQHLAQMFLMIGQMLAIRTSFHPRALQTLSQFMHALISNQNVFRVPSWLTPIRRP